MSIDYEKQLWKVLEQDSLAELSQFHREGSYDEVPLFSREGDVAFLPRDKDAASEIVLGFALKFLKALIAYEEHPTGFFAAITVWSIASDPLIPYLFAWCGDVRDLKEKLLLTRPTTSFAKKIKKLVSKVDPSGAFELGEDTLTLPGEQRIFVVPERLPYRGFLPLSDLHKRAKATR